MWRFTMVALGIGLVIAGCAAPPAPAVTPTLLPVQVQVSTESAPTLPPATASPTWVPTATNAPTRTELPPSPTPTRQAAATLPATSIPTTAPAASTETPTATAALTTTPEAAEAAVAVTSQPGPALPPGVTAQDVAAAEQQTIDLINAQRAAASRPPLARDEKLMSIARARVADMVARNYTGHYDPVTGEGLGKAMMRAAGYNSGFMAENWYGWPKGPAEAVNQAMNFFIGDPPHNDVLIGENFVGVGVGLAWNGKEWLLVQDFAGANH